VYRLVCSSGIVLVAMLAAGCNTSGRVDVNSQPASLPECQATGDISEPGHEGGKSTMLASRCHPESGLRLPLRKKDNR